MNINNRKHWKLFYYSLGPSNFSQTLFFLWRAGKNTTDNTISCISVTVHKCSKIW